jgi:hypothetical protein
MSFEELAAQIRADEIRRRQLQAPLPAASQPIGPPRPGSGQARAPVPEGGTRSVAYQETANTLRAAAELLRRGDPRLSGHPNRALKFSLLDRGHTVRGGAVRRIASAAVLRQVRRLHPGWPQADCLIRLVAEDGLPALQKVLLDAAGWCGDLGEANG